MPYRPTLKTASWIGASASGVQRSGEPAYGLSCACVTGVVNATRGSAKSPVML
jgi:hypothetical protein